VRSAGDLRGGIIFFSGPFPAGFANHGDFDARFHQGRKCAAGSKMKTFVFSATLYCANDILPRQSRWRLMLLTLGWWCGMSLSVFGTASTGSLAVTLANGRAQLAWPASNMVNGLELQSIANLSGTGATWLTATNNFALTNGQAMATAPLAGSSSFFRLGPARGAEMPYIKYEAEAGACGGGATVQGPSMDNTKMEAEASGRMHVALPQIGAYVQWNVQNIARGLVLRFSIPDAPNGGGLTNTLGLYLNGTRVATLILTSKFAWQYFQSGTVNPSNDPANGFPRMRFDDMRYIFTNELNINDVIKIQMDAQDTSPTTNSIDFIELEDIPAPIAAPANSLNVTQSPYNAATNDTGNDYTAFNNCIIDAKSQNKIVYIPPGRYSISNLITLSGVQIQGAGIWFTELHFVNTNSGGFQGSGSGVVFRDFYEHGEYTDRSQIDNRGFEGYFGQNSLLTNIWADHFRNGAWIGDYTSPNSKITDGIIISHCRFRNTYADGVNFAQGTKNSIVEWSHFRNNGDNAIATSSTGETNTNGEGNAQPPSAQFAPPCTNNIFRHNTIENTYRACGMTISGGTTHVTSDTVIQDVLSGSGFRFGTVYNTYGFGTNSFMVASNLTIIRCGTADSSGNKTGGLQIETSQWPVSSVRFYNCDVLSSYYHGILFKTQNNQAIITNYFSGINIQSPGQFGVCTYDSTTTGWSDLSNVVVTAPGLGGSTNKSTHFVFRQTGGDVGW
jgi:hypothetical protein